MDRAEEIIQELVAIAGSLDENIPVELDRRYDLDEDQDLPIVIVRSGDEEAAPPSGAIQAVFDRRWVMSPEVHVFFKAPTSQQRAEVNRLWAEFRRRFSESRILELISSGSLPEVRRTLIAPADETDIAGFVVELGLTFDRA